MFQKWQNVFTNDCEVVQSKNKTFLYIIYKNGYTSLKNYTKENNLKVLKNKELEELDEINIFLRDPLERFISGVHTVIEIEKIKNVDVFLNSIENLKYFNRHFMPQVFWLFHLLKYFKGNVKLLPIQELYHLIPNRESPAIKKMSKARKEKIISLNSKIYTQCDNKLIESYLGKTIKLTKLMKNFKNVLSSS